MIKTKIKEEYSKIQSLISDESLRVLFDEDVNAIDKLQTSIKEVDSLMKEMSDHVSCFDKQDAENVSRMRRVLYREYEWRIRRLRIAIEEYDNKIVRMMSVMRERNEILRAHDNLEHNDLLTPLRTFFADKQKQLDDYNQKLKDRMRELLHKPIAVDTRNDVDEPQDEHEWRVYLKKVLSPSLQTYGLVEEEPHDIFDHDLRETRVRHYKKEKPKKRLSRRKLSDLSDDSDSEASEASDASDATDDSEE